MSYIHLLNKKNLLLNNFIKSLLKSRFLSYAQKTVLPLCCPVLNTWCYRGKLQRDTCHN